MRGLIPATMIQYLCEQIGFESCEIFDIFGGTSIGGIIALGLCGRNIENTDHLMSNSSMSSPTAIVESLESTNRYSMSDRPSPVLVNS